MSLLTSAKNYLDQMQGRPDQAVRLAAWRRMEALGLPNRKTETWKYSSLAGLDKAGFDLAAPAAAELPAVWTKWLAGQSRDFNLAVLINGRLNAEYSRLEPALVAGEAVLPAGTELEDGFASLSLAVAQPGLKLEARAGRKIERPLVIFKFHDGEAWASSYNEITVEAGSDLRIAELFAGSRERYLRTDHTRVRVEPGARLTWLRRQNEMPGAYHFHEAQVTLARDSRLHLTHVHRGAKWMRGQLHVTLEGSGVEAEVHGLSFGENDQHTDQRIVVRHNAGENSSSQLFKGVYKDRARGTMNGKIYIARDAQRVASRQMNHNLLLSAGAEANTKPELEIYADDVKANHGATVGRLDAAKMFYLRSRGMTAADAERLLSDAFTRDVLMKIPDPELRRLAEADDVGA